MEGRLFVDGELLEVGGAQNASPNATAKSEKIGERERVTNDAMKARLSAQRTSELERCRQCNLVRRRRQATSATSAMNAVEGRLEEGINATKDDFDEMCTCDDLHCRVKYFQWRPSFFFFFFTLE